MQNNPSVVVILGTGGTIAGTAADATDNLGYTAAQIGVAQLAAAVPSLKPGSVETEQVAQVDSKDMSHAIWRELAVRCAHHLARTEVAGIVVTHGTDTLEETAWFLQRVLAPTKPVVLTAAMRPATAVFSDGPQNLLDAVAVARLPGARGVLAVLSGRVHGAREVRKVHPYRVDAFDSGDAGAIGVIEEGEVRLFREWPQGQGLGVELLGHDASAWPRVEVILNHVGASGALARALGQSGVQGIVVAATGNGTLAHDLEAALLALQRQGVAVLVSTRCADGCLKPPAGAALPSADDLTPPKARLDLMLRLMAAPAAV